MRSFFGLAASFMFLMGCWYMPGPADENLTYKVGKAGCCMLAAIYFVLRQNQYPPAETP